MKMTELKQITKALCGDDNELFEALCNCPVSIVEDYIKMRLNSIKEAYEELNKQLLKLAYIPDAKDIEIAMLRQEIARLNEPEIHNITINVDANKLVNQNEIANEVRKTLAKYIRRIK